MRAYDINIKQPARDDLFGKQNEQNIRIGTFFSPKADVVRRAKHIQKCLGNEVIVTVENVKIITSRKVRE